MAGILYVVGTPIGNLGDITYRAVKTLTAVDRIVAEDTRRTRALLNHLAIHGKPVDCVEAHAGSGRIERAVAHLLEGESIALVTDAGMPAISDPGSVLVLAAASAGISVQVVPGPSAVTAALSLAGLVEGAFYFLGFLPRESKRRRPALARIAQCPDAVVLFESPHRIKATLRELAQTQPERSAVVCRELTKVHEDLNRGTLATLAETDLVERGEFVIVLGAQAVDESAELEAPAIPDEQLLAQLREGQSPRSVVEELGLTGKNRRALYNRLVRLVEQLDGEAPDA